MKHISLGGLDVSRIGLGAMSMSGTYNIGEGSATGARRTGASPARASSATYAS